MCTHQKHILEFTVSGVHVDALFVKPLKTIQLNILWYCTSYNFRQFKINKCYYEVDHL